MTATFAEPMALADGRRPTDVGNSTRLVDLVGDRVRYVRTWGSWMVYRAGRWIVDTKGALITELGKGVPRALFREAITCDGDERDRMFAHAKRSESASAIRDMVTLARGAPGIAVEHDQLDTHEHLLNVANGTIDLRTGRLMAHDPDHLITLQVPIEYHPLAQAPLFERCLTTWQPDADVREYLQRAVGSGATGRPVERLFVNVGGGGNGKSKFFGAVGQALGPYFHVPDKGLFVAEKHEGHPTRVASLFGRRLIVAPETRQGARLDEESIKALTGGDVLTARRMREDEWQFRPSHTAFVHTNHTPHISGVDEGIWRRVRLIPWTVTIPAGDRDEHLDAKLADEQQGILTWIVAGAIAFYRDGLDEPATVRRATDKYRADSDPLGRFLAEKTLALPAGYARARELFEAWSAWCQDAGERPGTEVEFARSMTAKGYEKKGRKIGNVWIGVALTADDDESPPAESALFG